MDDERTTSNRLTQSIGYRVDTPEGPLGVVLNVSHAGRPLRPLALVVSDGNTVRLVSPRRVAEIAPLERRILLRPEDAAATRLAA